MKHEKYQGKESDLQKTVARYLNALGLVWFHCPNGGNRSMSEAKRFKAEGVKSGVPDVMVIEPNGKYNGLAIELKVGYNKPNNNQKEWLNNLQSKGFYTFWSNSLDEILEKIDLYLKNDL